MYRDPLAGPIKQINTTVGRSVFWSSLCLLFSVLVVSLLVVLGFRCLCVGRSVPLWPFCA